MIWKQADGKAAPNAALVIVSDAQKGAYAWGSCDPGAGSVLLYIDAVPEEALIFKLKIMEQTEG